MSPPHLFKIINHDYSWDAYDADRLGDDEDDDIDEDDTTSFPLMPKKVMLMHICNIYENDADYDEGVHDHDEDDNTSFPLMLEKNSSAWDLNTTHVIPQVAPSIQMIIDDNAADDNDGMVDMV